MEKYAVDIDKVLDDFEESEALEKVLSSQIPQESIFIEPWENLTKKDTKNVSGSKVSSDTKLIQSSLDESSQQQNVIEPAENASVKDTNEFNSDQNDYNENQKLWDYEIFYKPFQSMSSVSQQSCNNAENCNNCALSDPNTHHFHTDATLNDSHEEILCVSVQEKILGSEANEPTVNTSVINDDSKSFHNSFAESEQENAKCRAPDFDVNLSFPNDVQKCSKERISESLGDHVSSSSQLYKVLDGDTKTFCTEMETSVSSIYKDSSTRVLSKEKALESKEKMQSFDIPPTSCLYDKISGHTKIFSSEISRDSFTNIDQNFSHQEVRRSVQSVSLKKCTENEICEKDVTEEPEIKIGNFSIPVNFNDCNTEDITIDEMDDYLGNLSCIDPIQDEDSGINSQEDINGNALLELMKNKTANSKALFNQDVSKNAAVTSKFDIVSSKATNCVKQLKNEIGMEKNQNIVLEDCGNLNLLDEHSVLKSSNYNYDTSIISTKQRGSFFPKAQSKFTSAVISPVTEITKEAADKTVGEITLSIQNCSTSDSSKEKCLGSGVTEESCNTSGNSPKETLQSFADDENAMEIVPPNVINKDYVSQILNKCFDKSYKTAKKNDSKCFDIVEATKYSDNEFHNELQGNSKNMKHLAATSCSQNENDTSCLAVESFYESENASEVVSDGSCEEAIENDVSSSEKNTGLPQKLQRPTTLNLPFRNIAKAETADEVVSSTNSENCLDNSQIPSETPPEEHEVAGSGEYAQIGAVKPFWIPDADAANCMHCSVKFTVIKRRHHCRACGKVLCSRCCNQKARLLYLQNKEDRICQPCAEILSSVSQSEKISVAPADTQSSSSCGSSPNFSPNPQVNPNTNLADKAWRPHPNNPDDYCSTIPPLQQIQLSGTRPPPTVMVPIGVLKRGNKPRREPKQVIFSDGIRPGGDLTSLTETLDAAPAYRRFGRRRVDKMLTGGAIQAISAGVKKNPIPKTKQKRIIVSDADGPLPPILLPPDNCVEKMDLDQLLFRLTDEQGSVVFAVTKNIHVISQITKLDCCFGKECWCFSSQGLCVVGQDEVAVVLERQPGEKVIPRDVFKLFTKIYDCASKGSTFEELSHIIFPEGIFGSCEQTGFLFVRPTFQCLNKLSVPSTPFLVAILIQKWEVPWANVFPLRLMLRLGAECRYYPCSLVSVRGRKPVYFEIGQTIMSVLADLRNYQFTIPTVPGLVVHMEEKKTSINIPRNRYDKVMKVLSSNYVEHVLALGSNFSTEADSHLVCMQKDDGDYHTQAINIQNTVRRVTGASFIVFSGALKSSSGLSAKFSIVEDGLLVQIPQETMVSLNMCLRDMKDLTIPCGEINSTDPEVVVLQWVKDDMKFNIGVRSPIDGKSMEGVQSIRIHTSTDYAGEHYLIRWTEVFFLEFENCGNNRQIEMVDPCRLAETIAQSFCMALTPYLDMLSDADMRTIGLRVSLDSERDKVEYDVGACGKPLPGIYMNALDSGLIPVILRLSGSSQNEPLALELIFHILFK